LRSRGALYIQRYQARHIALGLCTSCSRRAISGLLTCRRHRQRKIWVCGECKKPLPDKLIKKRFHPRCRKLRRKREGARWRRLNKKKYMKMHRRAALRYQRRHQAHGLCILCTQEAEKDKLLCVWHSKQQRRRYAARKMLREIAD
jgi:hypothetical protein